MLLYFYLYLIGLNSGSVVRNRVQTVRNFGFVTNDEWSLWPMEREGNHIQTNWSIVEDGVTPVGDAFRNARIQLLTERLPVKVEKNALQLSKPVYFGAFKVGEAGDSVTHDAFAELLEEQVNHLSSGEHEIFVEDACVGSDAASRIGVRVTTDDPALALIMRTLMVGILQLLSPSYV